VAALGELVGDSFRNRRKFLAGFTIQFLVAGIAAACGSDVGLEDTVPAQPGFSMPDGGGAPITEEAACGRIKSALDETRDRLKCPAVETVCPGYIRPGTSAACLEYDEATVAACEAKIRAYGRCSDFDQHRCIVSAIPDSHSAGCVPPGDAGGDAEPDVASDSSSDTSLDTGTDSGGDGASDSGSDAGAG